MDYKQMALNFLKKTNTQFKIEFIGKKINYTWKEVKPRNCYKVTLATDNGKMEFNFWDSFYNTEISDMTANKYASKQYKCKLDELSYSRQYDVIKELEKMKEEAVPEIYDIFACLSKYDIGTFEDFCNTYIYDEHYNARKIYKACKNEYEELVKIYTEEQMEELREIN